MNILLTVDKALSFYRIWFTLGTILGMKGSAQWVSPGNALCGKKKIKKLKKEGGCITYL
jgi:hypothetical protein